MIAPRSTGFKLLASLVTLLAFLVVTEGIVRLVGVDTYVQNRFFTLNRALDYPDVFKKDRTLFWRLRPDRDVTSLFFEGRTYHINSLGLRGDEVSDVKNKMRVVALGNSCTFGWGIPDGQTFCDRLQDMLGESFNVINAGIPGYSTYQGMKFLQSDILKLHPDVLLVLFSWNDHWVAASGIADKDQKFPPQFIISVQNLLAQFHSYRLLKKALLSSVEKNPDSLFDRSLPVYRVGLADFRANLGAICDTASAHGARPILMTSPIPQLSELPMTLMGLYRYHNRYNDVIREVAESKGVGLVDLAREFDSHEHLWDSVSHDWIHFNARGHLLASQLIARYLMDSGGR